MSERHESDRKVSIVVNVRWFDGYLEKFDCDEARFGAYLLWMRLANGQNRHIPLSQVRWYSVTPESHERREATESREQYPVCCHIDSKRSVQVQKDGSYFCYDCLAIYTNGLANSEAEQIVNYRITEGEWPK